MFRKNEWVFYLNIQETILLNIVIMPEYLCNPISLHNFSMLQNAFDKEIQVFESLYIKMLNIHNSSLVLLIA